MDSLGVVWILYEWCRVSYGAIRIHSSHPVSLFDESFGFGSIQKHSLGSLCNFFLNILTLRIETFGKMMVEEILIWD